MSHDNASHCECKWHTQDRQRRKWYDERWAQAEKVLAKMVKSKEKKK